MPHCDHKYWVEVSEFRKKSDRQAFSYFSFLNSHHEFLITGSLPCNSLRNFEVWRRFSQFEELLEHLKSSNPYSMFPHLPPKSLLPSSNIKDNSEFIEDRRKSLDLMMKKLLSHQNLLGAYPDPRLLEFLNKNHEVLHS